jgi:hypothetical protein
LKGVSDAIKFIALMYASNTSSQLPQPGNPIESKVNYKDFSNDAVNEDLFSIQNNVEFVRRAYREWLADRDEQEKRSKHQLGAAAADVDENWLPTSYISYPFILSAATKAKILQVDSQSQMQRGQRQDLLNGLFSGRIVPYLILKVRRSNIVEDTMRQLVHCPPGDLKKPFKVRTHTHTHHILHASWVGGAIGLYDSSKPSFLLVCLKSQQQ